MMGRPPRSTLSSSSAASDVYKRQVLLMIRFIPEFGIGRGIWYGIFHSISAFCNAGFDLMGENGAYQSLIRYSDDWLVNTVIMLLIIIGGIAVSYTHLTLPTKRIV